MNWRSILSYLVVILGSSGLAWAVWNRMSGEAAKTPLDPANEIENPLWYRELSYEERLAALQNRLNLMTSTAVAAAQVGPIKDDVALLCRDERLVDWVVKSFHERRDHGPAWISAYMEIFARVRHEKFAPLVALGIRHPRFEPRVNALDAAITQQDTRSVTALLAALGETDGYAARRVVDALAAIGGDEAMAVVRRALESSITDVVVNAVRASVIHGRRDVLPLLERRLADEDPDIRLMCAWGIGALKISSGIDAVARIALDRTQPVNLRAQAVQFLDAEAPTARLEELQILSRDDAPPVAFEARAALVRRRDPSESSRLMIELSADEPWIVANAATLLGISGDTRDVELIRSRRAELSDDALRGFIRGTARGRAATAAAFLGELARETSPIAVDAIAGLAPLGEPGLNELRALAAEFEEGEMLGYVIVGIASLESPAALAALEGIVVNYDRRIWLYLRNNIRQVELALLRMGVR